MDLLGFQIADVGASTLLVGVFVAVMVGRLIPKGRHDSELRFRDSQMDRLVREAENWRAAFEAQAERADRQQQIIQRLVSDETAANRLVDTLQRSADAQREVGA